ncbi:hypothetical protein FB45DRAFT_1020658 [Roridomyces roridus]|uniref:Uncharacterized protein n=1 Tax=Roridomyces roridus TaxID=1738132 RepID=A0AAD7CAQ9_9AGAR|nr:hypothetical protein FB45DRAFT_1020658 [Roridomyces roridus]
MAPLGAPNFAGLVVYSVFPLVSFTIKPVGSGFNIIEASSGQALTSWAKVDAQPETPVTLAPLNSGLQSQQTWNIVAAPSKRNRREAEVDT